MECLIVFHRMLGTRSVHGQGNAVQARKQQSNQTCMRPKGHRLALGRTTTPQFTPPHFVAPRV
jgi:hypothetical protein